MMDRYCISEMVMPFLFGVAAFTSLGMAIGSVFELVRLITEKGLPVLTAGQLFLLRSPSIIVLTFPMSMLLATLLAYGRLSGDSELTAIRSCGVSIYRLIVPAIALALAVTALTFVFNEVVVPKANLEATQVLDRALDRDRPDYKQENILHQEYGTISVQESDGTVTEQRGLVRLFYARRFNGEAMQGLTVLDFSQGALEQIVLARSAQWVPEDNAWLFENGTNYIVDADGAYRNILQFDRQEIALSRAPLDLASTVRDADEMNIRELNRYINVIETSGDEQEVRKLRVRLHEKYSIPFVCLTFALVGAPLGLRPQRTSSSIGLGLSVLIIFGYYLAMFISQAMGQVGALGPAVAAWLPNAIGCTIGGLLVYRASQA